MSFFGLWVISLSRFTSMNIRHHWCSTALRNINIDWRKKNSNTFKPKKNIQEGTKQYQLKQYAEATLGSGNLKLAVKLPEGEDLNEWLAVNSMFYLLSLFGSCLHLHVISDCRAINFSRLLSLKIILENSFYFSSVYATCDLPWISCGLLQPNKYVIWYNYRVLHSASVPCNVCWSKVSAHPLQPL